MISLMRQTIASLTFLAALAAACSAPPVVDVNRAWSQCPPPGVELQDCVHPAVTLRGSVSDMGPTLNDLCRSPCTAIDSLDIDDVDVSSISELTPLAKLTKVVNKLEIGGNSQLTDLRGLESLSDVMWVSIRDNPRLTTLAGLENVERVTSIDITANPSLAEVGAFQKVTVASRLALDINPSLVDLSSLRSLKTVDQLGIHVTGLTTLDELKGLSKINYEIGLMQNTKLTSVAGLSSIQFSGQEGIRITDNPQLPQCEALALLGQTTFRRKPMISGNDTTATCETP